MCQRKGWGEPAAFIVPIAMIRRCCLLSQLIQRNAAKTVFSCWSASRGLPHSPQNASLRPEIPPNWYSLKLEVGKEYPASNCG